MKVRGLSKKQHFYIGKGADFSKNICVRPSLFQGRGHRCFTLIIVALGSAPFHVCALLSIRRAGVTVAGGLMPRSSPSCFVSGFAGASFA